MADRKDELEARRLFRQRLADLGKQYPQLTTPAAQERLAEALAHTEEETSCPDKAQATPEADRKAPAD